MLKIKDDVDLKEVEKILIDNGFQFRRNWHGKSDYLVKYGNFKLCKNRHILPLNGGGNDRFDVIFKLAQAGMLELEEQIHG